jgi:hypothetical protein
VVGAEPNPDVRGPDSVRRGFLFIGGCPRSGTTAATRMLNMDSRFVLGMERFKKTRKRIEPFHFREEVFFNPVRAESDFLDTRLYRRLHQRWPSPAVRYVGDKAPFYTYSLAHLQECFEDFRFVCLHRDPLRVADSYNARASDRSDPWPERNDHRLAIRHWNEALGALRAFDADGHAQRCFVLGYEPFFSGERAWLEALYRFLDLPLTEESEHAFETITDDWRARSSRPLRLTDEMVDAVVEAKDQELEAWCERRIAVQLERPAALA